MRLAVIAALAAVSAPAFAGSIDVKSTDRTNRSVEFIRCDFCEPEVEAKQKAEAPVLKPGEQKIEIRTVNGQKMIYRTEAFMGGSPVVIVSKLPASLDSAVAGAETPPSEPQPVIDRDATTSAVTADMQPMPPAHEEAKAEPQSFDPAKLELRLR
ncbi:plant virulence effector HPE1-like domain-containing protein [Rhizobium sp. FKL33]|uniref:plant virulence effector HPE1-like domain-containing protein n=1 Tax=Rhizobium sp. FKL33 TaxID=2562307 RepID=UPI0010C09CF5|nr:plant virulence effector HPE1-like domain-containing protein [Rhizobium sp. FKL33]